MGVNKVTLNTPDGERVIVDFSGVTVTPEKLAEGETAINASGDPITGTLTLEVTAEKIITALGYTPANSNLFPVTSSNIHNSAITRAKLAQDAMYSPIAERGTSDITISDIGKTLMSAFNTATTYTLKQANSNAFPNGAEVAILSFETNGVEVLVKSEGVRFLVTGESGSVKNATLKVSERFGMIALKKISTANELQGDAWLVTGNVEVVE